MNKKYLLIGGIAIFAAWWFFFRNTETEDPDTADDQPEGNEEAEENTTVVIATSLRGGRTTAGLTQPNRSGRGKGITNNRRSGEAAITYEPIYQHYEAKIYTPNN